MSNGSTGRGRGWTATLAWVLLLLVIGAGLAVWGLTHWDAAARFFGIRPDPAPIAAQTVPQQALVQPQAAVAPASPEQAAKIADLENRLRVVEANSRQAAGSVGR